MPAAVVRSLPHPQKPYPQISDMNSSLRSLLQLPEDSGRSYPKVLVVEDDEVNAMILKQVLEWVEEEDARPITKDSFRMATAGSVMLKCM